MLTHFTIIIITILKIFAGAVMTSFNHVTIQTRGNWFQTKPLDHESDHAVCVLPNGKDTVLQRQI